jgi:hypothetical protein
MKDFVYPDWEGTYNRSKHHWGEDNICIICGQINEEEKMKYTSKNWKAKPANLNIKDPMFYKADVISGGIRIAQVSGVGEDCANANARLVAAAPKLLEACKQAEKAFTSGGDITKERARRIIEQVIAEVEPKD